MNWGFASDYKGKVSKRPQSASCDRPESAHFPATYLAKSQLTNVKCNMTGVKIRAQLLR